jgi:hypothetical protein
MWKAVFVDQLGVLPGIFMLGLRETRKKFKTAGFQGEIRIVHLLNKRERRCRFSQLARGPYIHPSCVSSFALIRLMGRNTHGPTHTSRLVPMLN